MQCPTEKAHNSLIPKRDSKKIYDVARITFANTMLIDHNLFWEQTRFLTILHKNVKTIVTA